MLMLCTGSGIAPFISFFKEINYMKKNKKEIQTEIFFIFGTMNKKNDFIFEKELEEFKKNKIIKEYYTAFSRDQDKKIYVQDILEINFNKEKMEQLMNKGLTVFICGSSSMGNEVNKKLKVIMGNELYDKMVNNKRLISETWENKK